MAKLADRPLHRDLVGLSRRRADARLPRLPRVEVARRVRRVGGGVREPVRRPAQPDGVPQLGLRPSYAGARGRRRRRRGAVPEHDPAVLPVREPARHAPADRPGRLRPPLRRAPGAQPLARRLLRRDARAGVPASRRSSSTTSTTRWRRSSGRGRRTSSAASCSRAWRPTRGSRRSTRRDYEPIWAVCEDLDMPINNHAGQAAPDFGRYPASPAVFIIELSWYSHRVFWHMLFGNVFARHPRLQARAHRAVVGLGAGGARACSTRSTAASSEPGTVGVPHRGRGRGGDGRDAERVLGAQLLPRFELPAPERVRAALRDRRRQDHVGPGLPARRGHVPVHHRSAAQHASPTSPTDEVAAHGRRQRGATSTASTSTRSRRSPRASARPSTRSRPRSTRSPPTPTPSPSPARPPNPGNPPQQRTGVSRPRHSASC